MAGATVAVLDTGIDTTHPDLADAVIAQNVTDSDTAGDRDGHGTLGASTITGSGAVDRDDKLAGFSSRGRRDGAMKPEITAPGRRRPGAGSGFQWAKSQRVAPGGSALATPTAVRRVRRNRCHGGGPALGAENGAVNASPSTVAGQPFVR